MRAGPIPSYILWPGALTMIFKSGETTKTRGA